MGDTADDLERLVEELNSAERAVPPAGARIDRWLELVAQRSASDLLLLPGEPPMLRIEGRVVRTEGHVLDGSDVEEMVFPVLPAHAKETYRRRGSTDASRRLSGLGRFRINLHRERGRAAATIRMLPARVPALSQLQLPAGSDLLCRIPRGLVIVGGATGSGKTTTVAAIVDDINRREAKHIVTIEDPIEYEHTNQKGVIQQVEIGSDAPDFPTALRSALRQAPDVLVVGEMRDPETMRIALAAAETGHLVLTTLHTTDIASTIGRLVDSFPSERQPTVRQEIAAALAAVFVQTLIPRRIGGLVPAAELLMVSYGARQHIRRHALQHLHQEITITRRHGSFTLEESLSQLVKADMIERGEAALRANHPEDFEQTLASGVPSAPATRSAS
jgi:twitching motility protein PilT